MIFLKYLNNINRISIGILNLIYFIIVSKKVFDWSKQNVITFIIKSLINCSYSNLKISKNICNYVYILIKLNIFRRSVNSNLLYS